MRYFKQIFESCIVSVGTGFGNTEISEEEYNGIMSVIHNRPIPQDGYAYRLREDLTWELYELPPVEEIEEEISGEELLDMIEGVL